MPEVPYEMHLQGPGAQSPKLHAKLQRPMKLPDSPSALVPPLHESSEKDQFRNKTDGLWTLGQDLPPDPAVLVALACEVGVSGLFVVVLKLLSVARPVPKPRVVVRRVLASEGVAKAGGNLETVLVKGIRKARGNRAYIRLEVIEAARTEVGNVH